MEEATSQNNYYYLAALFGLQKNKREGKGEENA